jgi:hypothetical protein
METKAESLARRNTLKELRTLESQAILNESDRITVMTIGLLFCVIGTLACICGGVIAIAGCVFFVIGGSNVLLTLFADLGPSVEEVRAAILFKQKYLAVHQP